MHSTALTWSQSITMQSRPVRSAILLLVAAMLATPLGACSLWDDQEPYRTEAQDPADMIYNQGLVFMQGQDYEKAAKRFDQLDKQYPMSEWSKKAVLLNAYANYEGRNYDDAISSAKRYVTLYPNDKDAAYAAYIYANANYAQIPDITRDQDRTLKALDAFQQIVTRWPQSEYAEDARYKLQVTKDQLAGKEMDVGRYYLNQQNYSAAVNRFKGVIAQFQQTRHTEEALSRLTECYMSMGLTSEAQTAAAILGHNYPNSPWYKDAYQLVKSNGLEPREDTRSWLSQQFHNILPM